MLTLLHCPYIICRLYFLLASVWSQRSRITSVSLGNKVDDVFVKTQQRKSLPN